MGKPKIAGLEPFHIELEHKAYWWCACGHSRNQPFCDGSHKTSGTGITPHKFEVKEKREYWLCMCKHTGNPPYCDGMHCKMDEFREK